MSFDICKGMICHGNHMESGHYLAYLSWDEHPLEADKVKEVWLITPEGKRICYFDPQNNKEWFSVYHDFDAVIGAKIIQSWKSDSLLVISANCDDGSELSLDIAVASWQKLDGTVFEGVTDTGKKYRNTPDEIGVCGTVTATLNGLKLGVNTIPEEPIYLGDEPLPTQSIVNRCVHELEP